MTVFNPIASVAEATYEKLDSRILREESDEPSLSNAGLWLRQSDAAGNQIIIHAGKFGSPDLVLDNVTLFFFDRPHPIHLANRCAHGAARNRRLADRGRCALAPDKPPQPLARWRLPTQLTPHKIEESFASPGHDVVLGIAGLHRACSSNRAFRRSAIACITTCCSRGRFCCARWCWSRRSSACACSGAAAPR